MVLLALAFAHIVCDMAQKSSRIVRRTRRLRLDDDVFWQDTCGFAS